MIRHTSTDQGETTLDTSQGKRAVHAVVGPGYGRVTVWHRGHVVEHHEVTDREALIFYWRHGGI